MSSIAHHRNYGSHTNTRAWADLQNQATVLARLGPKRFRRHTQTSAGRGESAERVTTAADNQQVGVAQVRGRK